MSSDSGFDPDRFEELASKAEENDLSPEEVGEFREQHLALREQFVAVYDALVECIQPVIEDIREGMRPVAEFCAKYPEVMENAGVSEAGKEAIGDISNTDSSQEGTDE